jgi:transcription termination factor Rho
LLRELQGHTSIDPHEHIVLETEPQGFTTRALDLLTPIGKGQRCLIVAPPKAGKTTLLKDVALAVLRNHPEIAVIVLLVDERPEEVTDFRRAVPAAEIFAASSDQLADEHIVIADEALHRALESVLAGRDVLLLLDSITRLARAYNVASGSSGRTLTGGLDATTMQTPRQIFGAARKIEGGGSLTILGTALIQTGSRMDDVIFQEFKGTGNMELVLSRELFEKRIFPCIDITKSGTRKEEKLYAPDVVGRAQRLRRALSTLDPAQAMEYVLELLRRYPTNRELLASLPMH